MKKLVTLEIDTEKARAWGNRVGGVEDGTGLLWMAYDDTAMDIDRCRGELDDNGFTILKVEIIS